MTFDSNNELDREFVRGLLREVAKRTPEPPRQGWSANELEQYVIDDDEGGFPPHFDTKR